MFIAALFMVAKTLKQLKCPSVDDGIKKRWYIYTMECYSAIRKDKILPFVTTWMNLENIMVSEISQREKEAHDFTHMWYIKLKATNKKKTKQNKHRAVWCLPERRELGEIGKSKGNQIHGGRRRFDLGGWEHNGNMKIMYHRNIYLKPT